MTEWQPRRQIVNGILPMWRACRTGGGTVEKDIAIYGTQGEALHRARELNAKEKAPGAAATAQGAEMN